MKASTLRFLIVILSAVLIVAVTFAIKLDDAQPTQPHQMQSTPQSSTPTQSQPESSAATQPASSVVTTPPITIPPTSTTGEYIGSLYTREFLESLPSESTGYGPGKNVDSKNRPTYAISLDKQYEKYDAHFICPDDGKLYLTYNVTYEHEGLVQKTLNTLKEKNVQCVIFIDKAFVRDHPQMVQQILADGHILANHCTTHPDLPTLSIDKIVSQIMDVHNYVKDTYGYEMKLFRPPSGYFSEQVWAIAQSLGYRSYNFSFTHLDYDTDNQPDPAKTLVKMTNAIHSGAIYQLHAISSTNEAILTDFIDAVREKGLEFALLP